MVGREERACSPVLKAVVGSSWVAKKAALAAKLSVEPEVEPGVEESARSSVALGEEALESSWEAKEAMGSSEAPMVESSWEEESARDAREVVIRALADCF